MLHTRPRHYVWLIGKYHRLMVEPQPPIPVQLLRLPELSGVANGTQSASGMLAPLATTLTTWGEDVMRTRRFLYATRHPFRTVNRRRFRRDGYARIAQRGLAQVRRHSRVNPYQPLYGIEEDDSPEVRPVIDRWNSIQQHLPQEGSVLDVGCMNGWFTFKCAERGLTALGIDSSPIDIQTARLTAVHNNAERAAFARMELGDNAAAALPRFDVVLCLSVFHHLVRFQGLDYAVRTMEALSSRVGQQIYFETGQSNEFSQPWASKLDFMGEAPDVWVEEFVRSLGFPSVTRVGSFPGYRTDAPRVLVVGQR